LATQRLSPLEQVHAPGPDAARRAIDIVVPVYKSAQLTSRCLGSLADHIGEIARSDPRLIIINDSPGEADVAHLLDGLARRHSFVTVLENARNMGFVSSVNRGLEIALRAGRDLILVNSDTETFAGTLSNLVAAARSDPQIGFASPRSNNASLCSLPHFHGGTPTGPAESYERWQRLSRTMPALHFAPTAVGFYLFIKHAIIANFGFLDPEFGMGYEEENDLICRANKVGYRAILVNNAFAYHAGAASFGLLGVNLPAHQGRNLEKLSRRHPEYLPLVRRYEDSAQFRAEVLLGELLPTAAGRVKLVFDLSAVGPHYNGTNEMGKAIIDGFCERHGARFDLNVICTEETLKFHQLDRHRNLRRHEPDLQTPEKFAIGIQLGQPFSVHALNVLEDLAAVNVFGMLDTIAEDCGYLSVTHRLDSLWRHVVEHANGLFFNSVFSEQTVIARYPDAVRQARYARLLPTRLSSYPKRSGTASADHVLIMGNHFAHKASDATAETLRAAFPTLQFVVLGKENGVSRNLRRYRSGTLGERLIDSLYTRASVVVLPSHVEGFGLGLVHALAAGKVVVARDIPATREILQTYRGVEGVFLYEDDTSLVETLRQALTHGASRTDDAGAPGWDQWVDGFAEFCLGLLDQGDIFERLARRIRAGDLLRKAELLDRLQAPAEADAPPAAEGAASAARPRNTAIIDQQGREWQRARHVKQLLSRNGEEFVYSAYVTLLDRLPDSDGLVNYLAELQSGVSKLEVVSRLRHSSEGRQCGAPLAGYHWLFLRTRLRQLFG
jgi:GT2 family glycosyltransferase